MHSVVTSQREHNLHDENVDGLTMPHKVTLVITLRIFDTDVRRVLIDPGSSTNIIQSRVVEEMELTGRSISKVRLLSRFNNSCEMTRGELALVTNAEWVTKDTPF